uniref:Uncharacterized protein n=1 Tax=Glossina austeni TaxID=7395 RepID=A0A1A9UNG5_GLOAU
MIYKRLHWIAKMVLSHVLATGHPYRHNDKAFLTLESIKNDYMLYNSSDTGSYSAGHNERNHYHDAIKSPLAIQQISEKEHFDQFLFSLNSESGENNFDGILDTRTTVIN